MTGKSNNRPAPSTSRINAIVHEELQSRIVSGEYAPGEWISVEDLARQFQVSRQPIMEAMRRLSSDWLVDIVPQVGCRVAQYDQRAIVEFINVFGDVEGIVAEMAALRRTEAQLSKLVALSDRIRLLPTLDSENEALSKDYHGVIMEMAHSEVLARLCSQYWSFGSFALSATNMNDLPEGHMQRRADTIGQLTDAIARQSPKLARLQMTIWLLRIEET